MDCKVNLSKVKPCPLRGALYLCSFNDDKGNVIVCGYDRAAPKACPLRMGSVTIEGMSDVQDSKEGE